jgi:site-specific DNA recombinase
MRIATYTRISTDEDHQPYSLEAQSGRLRSYIESQEGWELAREFSDQASGATTERPSLQRALTEARARRFDLLLVYRVDRLARSVRGLAGLLEQLDQAGVSFRSATEPFDTATPSGRMMVQMLGVFAEFERATIIDRVIAGMERKAARGEWTAGSAPYGYEVDPESSYLAPNPTEAPLVPVIFDRYARDRMGAKAVAGWLNDRGYRTRAGRPWNHMAVLTVLRNRAYLGEIYFRGVYHRAPHPPLVDRETYDLTQQVLEARGEDYSHRAANGSEYLLAGLIVCDRCGKRFVGTAARGNKYRHRYYTCFSRARYGTATCPAERLPAEQLEPAVVDALLETYQRHDLIDRPLRPGRIGLPPFGISERTSSP